MNERPLSLIPALALAALRGDKTQTRRLVTPMRGEQSTWLTGELLNRSPRLTMLPLTKERNGVDANGAQMEHPKGGPLGWVRCPFGFPGDRLWLRERVRVLSYPSPDTAGICYEVDGDTAVVPYPARLKRTPVGRCIANGCHKEAARAWFEVTGVRVEWVQDITEADARAEGCDWAAPHWPNPRDVPDRDEPNDGPAPSPDRGFARDNFRRLWNSLTPTGSRWEDNPWVWVIDFKRMEYP